MVRRRLNAFEACVVNDATIGSLSDTMHCPHTVAGVRHFLRFNLYFGACVRLSTDLTT
jgi:hypothetical protein